MKKELTYEDLLLIPELIMSTSKSTNFTDLLSEEYSNYYFNQDLKKNIQNIFRKFKDIKYILRYDNNYTIKAYNPSSTSVKNKEVFHDSVGTYIERNVDLSIWANDFYYILLSLSAKLTFNEAIYLVDSFFEGKSEEQICEKLSICRRTLQKIKKSCLVKVYFEFKNNNIMD